MIVSFRGKLVAQVAEGKAPKGFPVELVARAERRLRAVDMAVELGDLRSPPGNRLEAFKVIVPGNIRSGSTINGASASDGRKPAPKTSRSSTTTDRERRPENGGS